MRLTESQLRRIIREEKLRITPVRRGQLMSEQRADYLAQEVLAEGLWGDLKAAFKGGIKGVKSAGGAVAGIASDAVQAAVTPLMNAAKKGQEAIAKITDDAMKASATEAAESLKTDLAAAIQKETAKVIQKLVKSGKTEEEAKAEAAGVVSTALSAAVGAAGQAGG